MKKIHFFLFLLLLSTITFQAQCVQNPEFNDATPKRDLRGVFLASVYNLNWPTNRLATPSVQQAELRTILDNIRNNGYNTVFLQVRSECDALYSSTIEPWSYRLTGTQGLAPSPAWDPLAFAITEAHSRGLDLHAWLNPYRASANISSYTLASSHVINTHPSWIITASNNANLKILDPGLPAVQDYIKTIVEDISTRYDVDGIHFDDYFYPDGGMTTNQDNTTYINNNPTAIPTIADWRRNNVNVMIGKVFDAIQTINANQNKNIVFGVSPAGIWKNGVPTGITGNPSYSALYCDPIAWLNNGKVDYLAPQLYWKITGAQDYVALSKWWNDQVAAAGKQLYVSQAYYRMSDASNWDATEIQNQTIHNRSSTMNATFGQIAYNYNSIKNNDKSINTLLTTSQFQYKSFAPPIVGKDNICPNPPVNIRFEGNLLKWDTPAPASDGDLPAKYVVYAFDNASQAISNQEDGSKIIDIIAGNQLAVSPALIASKYFVVSSLDKNNNEKGLFNQTTLSVENFVAENQTIVYPNPTTNYLTIDNLSMIGNEVKIKITELTGKIVFEEVIIQNGNINSIVIPTNNLNNGFYLMELLFENNTKEIFKIIKE